MPLSRRHFLYLMGIVLTAPSLPHLPALITTPAAPVTRAPSFEPIYGRALGSTPIYAAPNIDALLMTTLWSDTVASILGMKGEWYRLREGYALRQSLQPMIIPAQTNNALLDPPSWAEVSGAIAILRDWCSVRAPLVTRIGHGGVLRVIDHLPGEGADWYGLAETENGALLGWSMASVWSPVQIDAAVPSLSLAIDPPAQSLQVRSGDQVLLTAPISTGRDLQPGTYPITQRSLTLTQPDQHGVSYALTFGGDLHLAGVYWHNRFGTPTPGAAIQMATPLARWLYPRAAEVIIC